MVHVIISMTIKIEDFHFDSISLDEKPNKNNLNSDISHKTLIGAKSLRIRFNKLDGFIRVYYGTTYLIFFRGEKYGLIYNRVRYLI